MCIRHAHLGNHKFFLIFLAHATLFCIYIFCSMVPLLISVSIQFYTLHPQRQGNHHEAFLIPFALSIVGCCAAFWSLWADLFKNRTILEDLAVETGHTAVTTNKYDLGSRYKNVEAIFGEQKWHWFLPLHTAESQLNRLNLMF
ncbi:Palmitoyltransferase [Aphelenchoides bicaudatus]|nr:Palmitoyltransferase [Aphelenchoides bicaudatus]